MDVSVTCETSEDQGSVTIVIKTPKPPLSNGQFFGALLQLIDRFQQDMAVQEDSSCGSPEEHS